MGDATLAVRAYAFAATMQPRTIEALLPARAERVRLTKTIAIVRYGPTSWVVAHDFGAIVFVDVEAPERERVMKALRALVGDEPHPPLEETYAVEVTPGATPSVGFERVVVGELDGRTVAIIALVVAQSVAMEYYETDVDELVAALEKRSRQLAADGVLRGRARDLMRFIGRGMTMRSSVILTLSLLESPGVTWENESLDRLYRGLRASFEIEERYRALDHEIRIVQDDLALMVDMVRQRRFIFLEVVVAVFVVVEALAFLGELLLRRG
jgi:required for meiotic nuclear division protein 1